MKLQNILLIAILSLVFLPLSIVYAQTAEQGSPAPLEEVSPEALEQAASPVPQQELFYRGEVIRIIDERKEEFGLNGTQPTIQTVRVKITSGDRAGQEEVVEYGSLHDNQKLIGGQSVVLVSTGDKLYVFDKYRLISMAGILALFVLCAILFAGWKGITSVVGLGVSVLVLTFFIVPQIMQGRNPLLISLVGAFVIAIVSIYLAHGFNRQTTIAVSSTLISVVCAIGLAQLFVWWTGLTGSGSEEAYYLQTSPIGFINLKGLLLGGIIIGALGVLDDITTAQTAAVYQIWRANPKLSRKELFQRGRLVGKEHITSLVNTLALAYVGASFPALLLFTVYQRPWWVVANTEIIAEEIIRTLVGSIALMLAVPITTYLAVQFLPKEASTEGDKPETVHTH